MLRQVIIAGLIACSVQSCNEEDAIFVKPNSSSNDAAAGSTTPTTDFSNIALKTHIPKEIPDGAGGVLTITYQDFAMGNSDASIVYHLKVSDNTYRAYKPDTAGQVELFSDPGVLTLDVSGGGSKVLSHNGLRDVIDYASGATQSIGTALGLLSSLTINNAGDLVAFTSNADLAGGNPGGVNQIFTLTTDGSETYNQITSFTVNNVIEYVSISGDSNKVFFSSSSDVLADGSNTDASVEIYSIDSNGTNLSQHTTLDSGIVRDIRVSTTGNTVAMVLSNYNGSSADGLYALNTTIDAWTHMTDLDSPIRDYDISADGNIIVYVYTDATANVRVLHRIRVDGTSGANVLVTDTVGGLNRPHVNATGSQITFESGIDFGKGVAADENTVQLYTITVN